MSPPLQKEARLFSSFHFSVPKYTLKERKNWWHKIFFAIQYSLPEHIKFKHPFQPFIRDILKFQSGTSSWASICVRFPHVWIGKSAIIVGHLGKILLLRLRISLSLHLRWTYDLVFISICVCICIARVNKSSEPSMEWHTYNNRAE